MAYRPLTIGFLVALILTLPLAHFKLALFGMPFYVPELFVLLAAASFLADQRQKKISLQSVAWVDPMLLLAGALFSLGAIFSLLANPVTPTGLGMLKTWFGFPLLMAWLFFQLQPNGKERSLLLRVWLFVSGLTALGALGYALFGSFTYDGRLTAWFASPNYLAIFLAPGVLIAYHSLANVLPEKRNWKEWTFPLVSLALLLVALFLTRSYGVWLGVFGAALIMTIKSAPTFSRKQFIKVFTVLVIVGGIFLILERDNPKWQSLVSLESRSSMVSRIMIWQSAAKMLEEKTFFGIGLGRFQEVYLEYQKYFPPYLEWAVPQPHSIFLAVWLQTGILGLIGFSLLIGRAILILIQNKNRESALLLGLLALYLIYGIFDTPYFKTDLAFSFWLIIGLIVSQKKF